MMSPSATRHIAPVLPGAAVPPPPAAAERAPVRPAGEVLHITQNRLREKTFLRAHGFPVTPFRHVRTSEDLRRAASELKTPAVLKTADFGYDGKGQLTLT